MVWRRQMPLTESLRDKLERLEATILDVPVKHLAEKLRVVEVEGRFFLPTYKWGIHELVSDPKDRTKSVVDAYTKGGSIIDAHYHPVDEILIILSGKVSIAELDHHVYDATDRDAYIILKAGSMHTVAFLEDTHYLAIFTPAMELELAPPAEATIFSGMSPKRSSF